MNRLDILRLTSILGLFATGICFAETDVQPVEQWSITGQIKVDGSEEVPKAGEVVWSLVWVNAPARVDRFSSVDAHLAIGEDGSFSLLPTAERRGAKLFKGEWVLGAIWKSRVGSSPVIHVSLARHDIKGIVLNFGAPNDREIHVQVVGPDLKTPVAKTIFRAYAGGEEMRKRGVQHLLVGEGETDDDGVLSMANLPDCIVGIQLKGEIGIYRLGLVQGNWIHSHPAVASEPPVKNWAISKTTPRVVRCAPGMGIYWDCIFLDVQTEEGMRYKRLDEGDELQFEAARSYGSPVWNPNLKFKVKVGKDSRVITPEVPEGEYAVSRVKDRVSLVNVAVQGAGSVAMGRRHDRLNSPWLLDGVPNDITVKASSGFSEKHGEVFSVYYAGSEKQRLEFKGLETARELKIETIYAGEVSSETGTVSNGVLVKEIDKCTKQYETPIFLRLVQEDAAQGSGRVMAKVLLYPVEVAFAKKTKNDGVDSGVVFLDDKNSSGRETIQYQISPWHVSLSGRVKFIPIASILTESEINISSKEPNDCRGSLEVGISSRGSGVCAITAVLEAGERSEACLMRMPIYIRYPALTLKKAGKAEALKKNLARTLEVLYPEPRAEACRLGVGRILSVGAEYEIPNLVAGLEALSEKQRKQLAEEAAKLDEDQLPELVLALAELAIKKAPLPKEK